jgi:hypothetical protein
LRLVIPTAARRGVSVQGKLSADRGRQTADRALRVARARPCLSDAIEGRGPGVRDPCHRAGDQGLSGGTKGGERAARLNLSWTLTIVPGFTARHEIEGRRPSLRRPSEVTEPP